MTSERWQRVKSLFERVLDQPATACDAFLDESGESPSVVAEVRKLISGDAEAAGFLQNAVSAESSSVSLFSSSELVSGQFRIVSLLGRGGMGIVYQAEDLVLSRPVALKFLSGPQAGTTQSLERLKREARAAAALNHPNICVVYETGEHQGQPFIVMELLEGQTLKNRMGTQPLEMDELLDWALQIAAGLEAAHQAGIMHRDIKPTNIFITTRGQVKILDFGLAKVATSIASGAIASADNYLTAPRVAVGTLPYMSPEQACGEDLDARTDLFGFGAVLYEMATGKAAFTGATSALIHGAILARTPPRASAVNGRIPQDLDRIIGKALEKDRSLRYQHAADLYADLKRLEENLSIPEFGNAILPRKLRQASATGDRKGIARRWKALVPAAAGTVAAFAAGYFYFHRAFRATPLTDKDTIVLADFENKTGDPVFDETLRQGLSVQLEQSPFLSLISEERIQRTLGLMARPQGTRLTAALGREICQRNGGAAVLSGSITPVGSQYVLGLRATNCGTDEILDEEQAQAARKEDVLGVLSLIAKKFRTRVGESLTTVKKYDTPLAEATTSSLEALKAYSAARKVQFSEGGAASLPLFSRAAEIDPQFAMAHANLGVAYGSIGKNDLSVRSTVKAYQLRDRASDWEKFFITASYARRVTGNMEKAQQTCELWAQIYPREALPHDYLAAIYPVLGKYDKAVEEGAKAIGLDRDFGFGYALLASHYRSLDRLEEAENTLRLASERKLGLPDFLVQRYDLAFLKGDQEGMQRQVALAHGNARAEDWITEHGGFVLAYSGHLQQAINRPQPQVVLAGQNAAVYVVEAALWQALFGQAPEAARSARAALKLSRERDVEYGAAFALALSGDHPQTQTLAADLEKRFPEDTAVRFSYLPALRALFALNHGEPAKAIEVLQVSIPYELGGPRTSPFGTLYPVYVRGAAFLEAHQGAEATVEFRKILDHRGIVLADPVGALARLQLGRALVLSGDKAKAKTAYQDFLALWKDADADLPVLIQARKENAAL